MAGRAARDGAEALEMLRRGVADAPYDLAILDMQMPDTDGLALARAIGGDPALAATRLVLLTSFGQRVHADEARTAGFAACLTKPVRQTRLSACLAAAMGVPYRGPARPATPSGDPRPLGGARVLVVEDSATNQRLAVRLLEKRGIRADVAADGREAVALANRPYDLILMDCQMPEMDGYEATRAIRAGEAGGARHAPIVAMTANAMPGDRQRCLDAGMDDYLAKPVDVEALDRVLARWLPACAGAPVDAAPSPGNDPGRESGRGEPALDPAVALAHTGGDPVLLREAAALFLGEVPRLMGDLREALARRDAQTLQR
jgi:CheY-like chemotaxis protein